MSLTFFAKQNSCLLYIDRSICRICSRFTIRQRIVICLAGKIVDQKKKVVLFYPFIVVIIFDSTRKLSFAHKIGSEVNILHIWEKF